VRARLDGVDRELQRLVDLLPLDHEHRVDPVVVEQGADRAAGARVAVVLEALDLGDLGRGALLALDRAQQLVELLDRRDEDRALLERVPRRLLDVVEPEQLGRVLDRVDDVVDRAASSKMSSRSNGVMNCELTSPISSPVIRSPACSSSLISSWLTPPGNSRKRASAARAARSAFSPAAANSS
jgi:hypothetical protein